MARMSSTMALFPLEWLWRRLRGSKWAHVAGVLLIGALTALLLWQISVAWRNLGFGLAFAVPAAALLLAAIRLRPRFVIRRWNTWVGLILLGFLAWGILAFFDAPSSELKEASLGGHFGRRIIGDRDALGGLRLAGIALLAWVFLPSRPSLSTLKKRGLLLWKWLRGLSMLARRGLQAPGHWALVVGAGALKVGLWLTLSLWRALQRPLRRLASSPAKPTPESIEDSSRPSAVAVAEPPEQAPPIATADEDDFLEEPDLEPLEESPAVAMHEAVSTAQRAEPPYTGPLLQEAAGEDGWRLPSLELLDHAPAGVPTNEDNSGRARAIEEALASYGIEASVMEINPGPAVTQFGVEPGWMRKYREVRLRDEAGKPVLDEEGNPVVRREEIARTRVKVDSIVNLDKDLAMAMAAPSIRIEAPVPGKSMVGIEVPNSHFEMVTLRNSLESPAFTRLQDKSKLALALGKGSDGETAVADLAKMPHLLVAGATGSGKSISLRSVLVCLLMHATPRELRLLLIDPKRVELVTFNSVPHLLGPVIQDTEKVVGALKWAIQEMEERYKKFSAVGARNLEAYNKHRLVAEPLPYLVIAIDELADLMMSAPYDIEQALTRLAQLGRATGIHLVVATQRPSVDVVTGLIKANFPTRMSFAVSSFVDSRTILDTGGAEKLLGRGDMLYLAQDAPKPKRIQGVFVSDAEVERVVRAWNSQRAAAAPTQLATQLMEEPRETLSSTPKVADKDPLMNKAREVAQQYHKLSPSLLQRRLKVGYTKAESLLERLKEEGYGDSAQDEGL